MSQSFRETLWIAKNRLEVNGEQQTLFDSLYPFSHMSFGGCLENHFHPPPSCIYAPREDADKQLAETRHVKRKSDGTAQQGKCERVSSKNLCLQHKADSTYIDNTCIPDMESGQLCMNKLQRVRGFHALGTLYSAHQQTRSLLLLLQKSHISLTNVGEISYREFYSNSGLN